jgi:hypothetical protein
LLEPLWQQLLFSCWAAASVFSFQPLELFQLASSVSLSEPLSESPSTIAAVTKDKILSIDLEASF